MERQNPMTNGRSNTKQIRTPMKLTLTETKRERKRTEIVTKIEENNQTSKQIHTKQKTWENIILQAAVKIRKSQINLLKITSFFKVNSK